MTIVVQSGTLRTAQTYVGAADLTNLTSPYAWCGLRAWQNSYIATGFCVDIWDSSDNFTTAIPFAANGLIDTNAVSTWSSNHSGATPYVKKLYDQSGNNKSFAASSGAVSPELTLTGGPSNGPCLVFSAATSMASVSGYSSTQPFCMSMVYRDPGTVNKVAFSGFATGSGEIDINPGGSTLNRWELYAGAALTAVATDATWHSANFLVFSTGSIVRIDSTDTTGDAGVNVFNAGTAYLGHHNGGGFHWSGKLVEFALWNSDVSAEFAALTNNQHAMWGNF